MNTDNVIDFVSRWPIGQTLTIAEFDAWLQQSGLLVIPTAKPGSTLWSGHVKSRNELRTALNRVARSADADGPVFQVEVWEANQTYIVRDATTCVETKVPRLISGLGEYVKREVRSIEKLAQHVPTALSAVARIRIDQYLSEVEEFESRMRDEAERFKRKQARLEASIKKQIGAQADTRRIEQFN